MSLSKRLNTTDNIDLLLFHIKISKLHNKCCTFFSFLELFFFPPISARSDKPNEMYWNQKTNRLSLVNCCLVINNSNQNWRNMFYYDVNVNSRCRLWIHSAIKIQMKTLIHRNNNKIIQNTTFLQLSLQCVCFDSSSWIYWYIFLFLSCTSLLCFIRFSLYSLSSQNLVQCVVNIFII